MKLNGMWKLATLCLAALLAFPVHAGEPSPKNTVAAVQTAEQVNINEADAATLERVLVGIGRSRAEAIVAYREANGKFYSADELTAVKGIGASIVRKNRDRIRVD